MVSVQDFWNFYWKSSDSSRREMIKMKIYHRSRKFAIVMFALIFLNSVIILELRGYQRRQNLILLQSKLKNESNKEVFDYIEEKSKTEDLILLISTNFIALMITVGFDRFGVFEKSDETINKNKKKLVKLFL